MTETNGRAMALCAMLLSAPLAAAAGATGLDLTREQLDVPYIQRHTEDPLAASVLPSAMRDSSVLVFFHGGGWSRGDKSDLLGFGRRLAAQGVTVVLPNYRLAPEFLFPAQAEDAAAALAWTLQHSKELGADKHCIFVGGIAAGAHLAALLATHPRYLEKAKVKPKAIAGIISANGVYRITTAEGGASQEYLASVFGFDDLTWRYASPIELVPRVAERRLAPFAVIWSRADDALVVRDSENFVRTLQAAGQAVTANPRDSEPLDAIEPALFDALSQGACTVRRKN
jgi:acetyl esterase/lipase